MVKSVSLGDIEESIQNSGPYMQTGVKENLQAKPEFFLRSVSGSTPAQKQMIN